MNSSRVIEVSALLRELIIEACRIPIEYDVEGRDGRVMSRLMTELDNEQARRVVVIGFNVCKQLFADRPVAVVGLHTMFEHHEAMNANALAAFLKEYRVDYPVAIDAPITDGTSVARPPSVAQKFAFAGTSRTR